MRILHRSTIGWDNETRFAVWRIAAEVLPRSGRTAYTHNQALMELGALVCTARAPRCEACPVRSLCATVAGARRPTAGRARTR